MFFIFTGLSGKYLPVYTLHAYLEIVVKNAFKIAKHERANRKGNLRSFLKILTTPWTLKIPLANKVNRNIIWIFTKFRCVFTKLWIALLSMRKIFSITAWVHTHTKHGQSTFDLNIWWVWQCNFCEIHVKPNWKTLLHFNINLRNNDVRLKKHQNHVQMGNKF